MKLSFQEKLGYGLGDTASNFVWATMMSFLMYYYTDIFGITAAALSALLFFARTTDGVADFAMGAIADRTTTRWGKFRPYLLWMSVPLALAAFLVFTTPGFGPTGKLVYAWITYNLLMLLYTAANIPYSALSGVMTDDPIERTSLNSYRMALSQVGGFIVNGCMLTLVVFFGRGNQAAGYQATIALFGVIAVALFLVTFFSTRERISPDPSQKTRLTDDLKTLFRNPHWVVMFVAGLTALTFIIVRCSTLMYYCKYFLHFDESQTSTFLVLGNVGFVLGAVVTRFIVKLAGRKAGYILTHIALALSCAAFYWIPPHSAGLANLLQVLNGAAGGANATLYWAMIADTADFGEWKFNVRTTGIIFSATTCSQKVGMGLGGALTGLLLTHFGYVAGAVQTPRANHGILLLVSLIPAAGFLFIATIFFRYGLNEHTCSMIRADLTQRRLERETPVEDLVLAENLR